MKIFAQKKSLLGLFSFLFAYIGLNQFYLGNFKKGYRRLILFLILTILGFIGRSLIISLPESQDFLTQLNQNTALTSEEKERQAGGFGRSIAMQKLIEFPKNPNWIGILSLLFFIAQLTVLIIWVRDIVFFVFGLEKDKSGQSIKTWPWF